MGFTGRPGVSPIVATLIAIGDIRREHAILDVGSGDGTEALLLAEWGARRVVGIDRDGESVAQASRRAKARGLSRRVEFVRLRAQDLPKRFAPASFDVVLHTLVANNAGGATDLHFGSVRRVLEPRGLLVVTCRIHPADANAPPGAIPPPQGLARHFRVEPGVTTHLPERRQRKDGRDYADVVVWLGWAR